MRRPLLALVTALAVILLAPVTARAQKPWPSRPITLLVPFAAGGNVDAVARLVAAELGPRLGRSVVVENVPGAAGVIGTDRAVRAEPDGHTLLMGVESSIVVAGFVSPTKVRYDALRDLAPITLISTQPLVLVGRADLPAADIGTLIERMRAEPNALSYGTSGTGTSLHLAGEMINQMAGTSMVHVPYKAGAQIPADLLGGNLDLAVLSITSVAPLVKEGRLTAFGITERRRAPLLPDVPPLADHPDLAGLEVTVWQALLAPAATPPAITGRIHAAMIAALADPALRSRLADLGLRPSGVGGDALLGFLDDEFERFRNVVTRGGVSVE